MKKMKTIELDGSSGEGGGQILRTALTLSMVTGQPFRITKIRAGRAKPGLMRQHLVAVQAAAKVSGATVSDAQVGSTTLTFTPGPVKGGDYEFAIGSAGSCTLVLQTLMPALLYADGPSSVRISGGTHNPMAPTAQFLQRAYCRAMAAMGAQIDIEMRRAGFYPAGGGILVARMAPAALRPIDLIERGERTDAYAEAFVAGIPADVGQRELDCIGTGMGWSGDQLRMRGLPGEQGPGNAVLITFDFEHVTDVFSAIGEKSVPAETIAKRVLHEARGYLASGAAVGEHLADQLMLPMALAGGGSFTTEKVSQHSLTNAEVIARFLPVHIGFEQGEKRHTCRVTAN